MYLFLCENPSYRQTERRRSGIHWFILQLAATAGAGLVQSQELILASRRAQGRKLLSLRLLLFQAHERGWVRSRAASTQPVPLRDMVLQMEA